MASMNYVQGYILYANEGEECGVTPLQNASYNLYKVCHNELSCVGTLNHDATFSYQCQRIKKGLGEQCSTYIDECANGLLCLKNEYEVFTCGGTSFWRGNIYGTKINSLATYETRFYLNTISLILLGFWILLLVFIIVGYYTRKKQDLKHKQSMVFFFHN